VSFRVKELAILNSLDLSFYKTANNARFSETRARNYDQTAATDHERTKLAADAVSIVEAVAVSDCRNV
jgi:hypothetical protein